MYITQLNSFNMNYTTKTKLVQGGGSQSPEQTLEVFAIARVEFADEVFLGAQNRLHTGVVPNAALGSNLGADGAAIGWVGDPANQLVRFQPIHELGNIGFYARDPLGQLSQGQRLIGLGEVLESTQFGEG